MSPLSMLLRVAAVYSLAWALLLIHPAWVPFAAIGPTPEMRSMAHGLAIANLAFAYLCTRAAKDPAGERGIVYAAMLLFGLRGIVGTYEVLYVLDMPAIVPRLFDMVFSLALFVGMLNVLPGPNRGRG